MYLPTLPLEFASPFGQLKPFSRAGEREIYDLLLGQVAIIGREVLFKGRSVDTRKFLDQGEILLEDHDAW